MTPSCVVRLVRCAWLSLALVSVACASEETDGPSPVQKPLAGETCGARTCASGEVCATYQGESACVVRCADTSTCGPGACCSYAHSAVGAYCVANDDPLGRAGDWCGP